MNDRETFLKESLQLIMDNPREAEPVYTYWQTNIDKIDKSLIETISIIASRRILVIEQQNLRVSTAMVFSLFSNLIRHFPLGNRSINIEIAIKGYQIYASVFTRQEYPAEWANAQYNLGICYRERIEGNRKQNVELAIAAYRASLAIFTRTTFPVDWADTQTSLADVYFIERIEGDRKQNIELAIAAYRASLEVYTRQAFSVEWARNQFNLGSAYIDRIEGNHKEDIELAIAAYRAALEVYTRKNFPSEWKDIQANLVNIASQYWPEYFAPYLLGMGLKVYTRENCSFEDDIDFLPNSKIPVRMLDALGNDGFVGFLLECTSNTR